MHVVLALLCLSLAGPTESDDMRMRIQALYDDGKFEEALSLTINEYRTSEGNPVFLYAGANAASALGDCRQAIALYERALPKADNPQVKQSIAEEIEACRDRIDEGPSEAEQPAAFTLRWAEAERAMDRCEDALPIYRAVLRRNATAAERSSAELGVQACSPEPEPEPVTQPAPPTPLTDTERQRDPWTPALMASGGVTLALGVGLIGGSFADAQGARNDDEMAYRDRTTRANQMLTAGIVLSSVGVGVLTAATIRLIRRRRSNQK